jgi:cell division protein FtsQ
LGALRQNSSLMSSSRAATPAGRSRKPASRSRTSAPKKRAPAAKRAAPKKPAAKRAAPKKRTAPKKRAAPKTRAPRRGPIAFAGDVIGGVSWRYRLATLAVLAITAAAGYFLWLRDSSLVAIDNVDVVGVTAGERAAIIEELTDASESMTTLHVDRGRLESIAAGYPTIASIHIDPNFPHGMRIEVTERPPTMVVQAGEQAVPVAGDGTLLTGVEVSKDENLPVLEVDEAPRGTILEDSQLDQALVVGAAPEELRPLIEHIDMSKEYGVEVTLRGGIPVRFGNAAAASEKWSAAAAVLADPKLDTVSYLDVRVPERPAAGGADTALPPTEPEA